MIYQFIATAHAAGISGVSNRTPPASTTATVPDTQLGVIDLLLFLAEKVILVLFLVFFGYLLLKLMRIMYEIYNARRLVYMQITLPRADSKLDKEKETKKDFKEKMGIMSIFYKSIIKISNITFWDSVRDFIFDHAKISMELVYNKGQLSFFVVTYRDYVHLVSQQITSNYPDAEVKEIPASDFPDIKPENYTLRASSIGKINDDIFPIKTYKYFEDDPLSTLTNNFGTLKKFDNAALQFVIKPRGSGWNRHAKNAAGQVAKGEYKKGNKENFLWEAFKAPFSFLSWLIDFFSTGKDDGSNAPGASS